MPPVDLLALEGLGSRPRSLTRHRSAVLSPSWRSRPLNGRPPSGNGIGDGTSPISTKAPWTHRLIPNVVRWEGAMVPRVPMTFHMIQALTGHGYFQQYLQCLGRSISSHCMHRPSLSDTAEHTLFYWPKWDGLRADLSMALDHIPRGSVFEGFPASREG